jgi:hypothetical protein
MVHPSQHTSGIRTDSASSLPEELMELGPPFISASPVYWSPSKILPAALYRLWPQ